MTFFIVALAAIPVLAAVLGVVQGVVRGARDVRRYRRSS